MQNALAAMMSLVLSSGLCAQPLTICTENAPPWQYLGPNGEAAGAAVDVVKEIQKRVGNSDPIRVVPWARGYAMVQGKPNVVLFLMGRTAERNALFQWVGPVVEGVYSFYVRADSPTLLRNLEAARKLQSIGVCRDDARDQLLTQAGFTNLERTTDNVMNAKKLVAGRIDAMVTSNLGINDLMDSAGLDRELVRAALPLSRIQFWIAFSRSTPIQTVKTWSRAFEAMKRDKSHDRIFRKEAPAWTPPGPPITDF